MATAALSPNQIANPVRAIVRRQMNTYVILDEAVAIDRDDAQGVLRDRKIRFDYPVLVTGAHVSLQEI